MNIYWLEAHEVEGVWHEIGPVFRRVVDKAVRGEFDVADILDMAQEGKAKIGVIRDESGSVVMAVAFEFRHYPRKMGVNVFAMGGRRMADVMDQFLESFKEFCRVAGADWIECSCSPAIARMHHRIGYKTVYQNLRLDLQEVEK